jgi:hypothetical protein
MRRREFLGLGGIAVAWPLATSAQFCHGFCMARASKRQRRIWDTYSFAGFRAQPMVRGIFGNPKARIIPHAAQLTMRRRQS